jgi:hypothetical protein
MPAIRHPGKTVVRHRQVHIQLSDEEERIVLMVQADAGGRRVGVFCRERLMANVLPRFEELKKRGITEERKEPVRAIG